MWTSPKITSVSKQRNGKALRRGIDLRVTGTRVARVNRTEERIRVASAGTDQTAGLWPTPWHKRAYRF